LKTTCPAIPLRFRGSFPLACFTSKNFISRIESSLFEPRLAHWGCSPGHRVLDLTAGHRADLVGVSPIFSPLAPGSRQRSPRAHTSDHGELPLAGRTRIIALPGCRGQLPKNESAPGILITPRKTPMNKVRMLLVLPCGFDRGPCIGRSFFRQTNTSACPSPKRVKQAYLCPVRHPGHRRVSSWGRCTCTLHPTSDPTGNCDRDKKPYSACRTGGGDGLYRGSSIQNSNAPPGGRVALLRSRS